MSKNEVFTAEVRINDQQAKKALKDMENELQSMQEAQKRLFQSRKKGDLEAGRQMQKAIDDLKSKIGQQKKYIDGLNSSVKNLSEQSYKNLKNIMRQLEKRMQSGEVKKHSAEWNFLARKIKECKMEMQQFKTATELQIPAWKRLMNGLNRNWGAFTQILGVLTGLTVTIRKVTKDFAEMDQEMANVRKYTGQTTEEVRQMNEDFKKMDTRTAREQLNQLAGAAGRLGITSTAMVEEFVDAADKIGVALGDDLGEDAVDKIGKLAMAFGEDDRMGLRGAMLATGSAINELAQNSSAQAGFLVDFTARVAGFGKQLGLTQAQIMGFGAVMDENLLRDEMAATAFGNMLTKMQTDTEKFAKIAGMSLKEFTDLIGKDANQAVLRLADSLRKQDPQTMMKMLDDMGLDGSRAVGVLATLADKIDDVRQRQELATKAYKEGRSVIQEFNIQNQTVEAELEKARKRFNDLAVELGERLLPIVKYTISSGALAVKALSAITGFLIDNAKALTALTLVIGQYVAMLKLKELWTKKNIVVDKIALALDKAWYKIRIMQVSAMRAYNLILMAHNGTIKKTQALYTLLHGVLMKNPWTLVATAIVAVTAATWKLVSSLTAVTSKQKLENDLRKDAAKRCAEERSEIELLLIRAKDENLQLNERRQAVEKLNSIIPGYNAQLDETTGKYEANARALENYNALLMEKYRLEASENKLKEIEKKIFEEEYEYQEKMRESRERERQGGGTLNRWAQTQGAQAEGSQTELGYQKQITKEHERRTEELKKQRNIVNGIREDAQEKLTPMDVYIPLSDPHYQGKGGKEQKESSYKTEAELKKEEADRKKQESARQKAMREAVDKAKASYQEQLAEEMLSYRKGLTSYTEYIGKRHTITQNFYDQLKKIYGEDSVEYRKLLDNRENEEREYYSWQQKMNEQDLVVKRMDREREIRRQFYDETNKEAYMNEGVLNENLFKSDIEYMRQRQNLYKEGSKEWLEIQMQIQEEEKSHQFDLEQDWNERLMEYRRQAGLMNYKQLQEIELKGVETLYGALVASGKMTQEEYDKIIEYIKRKYAGLKAEQNAGNDMQGRASSSLETAKKNAGYKEVGAGSDIGTGINSIFAAVEQQKMVNDQLKELYGKDYENNSEYQEAKRQLDAETMQAIVAGAQAAYSTINQLMSAASSYAKACSDLEVAEITANYDKQIAAAGNNAKKRQKLEKKRDEEIAKAKTKANRKAMAMEIAQAIAQTAMGAISAYSSTMAGAPWPANLVLAPISAGIALAAGALQIATIRKQHQAEEAGYYEGGYTGGKRYRKEAGVVHEGEFVANHQAVNNPNLAPVFSLLDNAQRNNRVASLSEDDVRGALGGSSAVVTPIVNIEQPENTRLNDSLDGMNDTQNRLIDILQKGIIAYMDTEQASKALKQLEKIKSNAK